MVSEDGSSFVERDPQVGTSLDGQQVCCHACHRCGNLISPCHAAWEPAGLALHLEALKCCVMQKVQGIMSGRLAVFCTWCLEGSHTCAAAGG